MKANLALILILVMLFFITDQSYGQIQLRQGRIMLYTDPGSVKGTASLSQIIGSDADRLFQETGAVYITNFSYNHSKTFILTVKKTNLSLSLFPKRELQTKTDIAVSYPNGLYTVFIHSITPLSALSQTNITKGTVCRNKKPFCTYKSAQTWQDGVFGIGYNIGGDHASPDFLTPAHFRSLSGIAYTPIVSNYLNTKYTIPTSVYSSTLTIGTKLSQAQPRETYHGVIEIVGIPNY